MEPLTRLFSNLVEQLRLLTPLGHNPHNGHPNYKGNGQLGHKQTGFPNNHGHYGNTNHHKQSIAHRDHSNDHWHWTDFKWSGHHQDSKDSVGHKSKFTKWPHTRIHEVESGSECNSKCSVASDFEEYLDEEAAPTPASPKKLVYPSQDITNDPEKPERVPFMRKSSGIHLVL